MKVHSEKFSISTRGFSDICDITARVSEAVTNAGIRDGIVTVFVTGSTASISTIEFEPALVEDFRDLLERLIPHTMETRHGQTWGDDNGFSHLRASLMGPGITVPVAANELVLGTWQQIILIDHDNRSRRREVFLQVIGQ